MKLTTGILMIATMAGGAWAQNPGAIDKARNTTQSVQQPKLTDKPAPGAPAPAVKPALILVSKTAAAPVPAQGKAASAKPASSQNNELKKVSVTRNGDDVQIEINSRDAVTPRVSKLSSPARVLVELPETSQATTQNRIAVGNGGVKDIRIGMDGKTPPTTSIVVDLEKAISYELTPGPSDKLVLTLHGQGGEKAEAKPAAKSNPTSVVAKNTPPAQSKISPPAAKPVAMPINTAKVAAAPKTAAAAKQQAAKTIPDSKVAVTPAKPTVEPTKGAEVSKDAKPTDKPEEKKWAMTGKRDPFFSPVVQQQSGSGCSTGKKCLEIGNINLRGVVKSEAGFIAVVTNNMNKAYFLRENDPVFNGYVVKITGDSVVFQETMQDKLGKPFTREVVKKITTPAV
jgi:hypothetical protein